MKRSILAFGAILAGAVILSAPAMAQTRIGAAAAVRNQVTAAGQSGSRALAVGGSVFQNDLVSTGVNSVAQLLFTDQTTLSVGPRSQVRLDRYVYDPSRSGGDVAVSLTSGALRFITGSQDPHNYQVNTPVATIGVRGTIVDLLMLDGRFFAILDEGKVIFTLSDGSTVELDTPGTALEFFSGGGHSSPFTWRGRYEASLGAATFPLFGNPFEDFPGFEGAYDADDPTNRTDDLNAQQGQSG
jgi:ferric-dicitrate binding protein FerR (iron transport regulator)